MAIATQQWSPDDTQERRDELMEEATALLADAGPCGTFLDEPWTMASDEAALLLERETAATIRSNDESTWSDR